MRHAGILHFPTVIQLTHKALPKQRQQTSQLIVRYKRAADALPSTGFGLSAKVISAILLMRGYEAFMYSKRNPYPKTIALLRWQLSYLESICAAYASTASKPLFKAGVHSPADSRRANDIFLKSLYKSLWANFNAQTFHDFLERTAARLRVLAGGGI